MPTIDPERTIAELVLERPARARVFEELQIDYCCGGRRTLAEAAEGRGLDARTLAASLAAAESADSGESGRDWRRASFTELCDHIVDVHHAFLRRELPRIGELAAKVAARHGDTLPQLREIETRFGELRGELVDHIDKEEEVAFPLCRGLDGNGEVPAGVQPQLDVHEAAHEEVGRALAAIRELAGDYRTEGALCTSHRILLESLRDLERDLHTHIHEENNVLFPRLRERLGEAAAAA